MELSAQILLVVGGLLLLGLVTDVAGKRTALPRVTLLVLFGMLVGPAGLGWLTELDDAWFSTVADMALAMVGFLLGEKLRFGSFQREGRLALWVSVTMVAVTVAVEWVGLWAVGAPLAVALVLGGVSPATDPAAVLEVAHDAKADGPFTRTLLGAVAMDDAWGLIAFSVALAGAGMFEGGVGTGVLARAVAEIVGAVALGAALGVPMAYLTGRIEPGEPMLAEALGTVFVCAGLALWLEVSLILSAMTLGVVVANLARHHTRPFHAIEGVEAPFLIMFFALAGASLELRSLLEIGLIGSVYLALRIVGRLAGGWLGAKLGGGDAAMRRWIGLAMMPQAGVAIGTALIAIQRFPERRDTILPVVVGAAVLFELLGPMLTKMALARVGEATRDKGQVGAASARR
jgi:Kef-type K+ transport system membrane component KefB